MGLQIVLVHNNSTSTRPLMDYFSEWDDQVWLVSSPAEAEATLKQQDPQLVIMDLHMLDNGWSQFITQLQQHSPHIKLLFTTNYPDSQEENQVRTMYGANVFLRQPFTRAAIEQALRSLEGTHPVASNETFKSNLPKVRVPVKIKITFPYVVLAVLLAIAAAFIVSQLVVDTLEERFTNQLIEAGKLANDWMVNEEDRLLETLRLIAYTQGVPEAVVAEDAERLRELVLPVAVNYQDEAVEILDMQGVSILSLHHIEDGNLEDYTVSRGDNIFSQWKFVRPVLEQQQEAGRDKFAGLAIAPWGNYLYVVGPILDTNGQQIGLILVGKSLPTLVHQIRQDTLAHVTIYDHDGQPLASTVTAFGAVAPPLDSDIINSVIARQDESSKTRPLELASIAYTEIIGPWEVGEYSAESGRTNNDQGLIGTAQAHTFLARPSQITRTQIFILTTLTFMLVIALGLHLANKITTPLLHVVDASAKVSQGNLDVQVDPAGNDEVAVLAHSFNQMVIGLREGSIYRDLFGRTVSPEVRDQLRQSFASGDLRLEGQEANATVLMCNVKGFTTLSEAQTPEKILSWLNEYFDEIVPIISSNGGIISKFDGDAILAFFGILPRPISAKESAYRGCNTALAILDAVEHLNARRALRQDPPFVIGVALNSGSVTAGGLGSADRIHYTVIGDTVNATIQLESITRQFGNQNSAVISQHTLFALQEHRHDFIFDSMGAHNVKGKVEQLLVYRLQPAKDSVGEATV